MSIPDDFLDELNSRTDIVDVVSSYVSLSKKGNKYWGLCPFHSEKTASFSVTPDKQMFYCFGCHKGGGAISFVMELEGIPFVDAVEELAKKVGMEIPEQNRGDGSSKKKRERLLSLNKEAARWFHANLSTSIAREGAAYLRKRQISPKTITQFGLGFAPESWDSLIKAMAEKGFEKAELVEVGLAVQNDTGRIYDRFRNRVMFPIIDIRGNVIGFGGRVLTDAKPKYLNSPDSIVYNKSRNLFALNIAKKSRSKRLILTEGYMDTIALHQAGFDCAIASLGTSLTEDHVKLISNYVDEVIISYDGDQAGIQAAQRAIGLLEKSGLKVRVLRVTGAKDPDEFIKKYGKEAFSELIDGSANKVDYQLEQIKSKYDISQDDQRISYLKEASKYIAGLSSALEREIYSSKVAALAQVSTDAVQQEITIIRRKRAQKQRRDEERKALAPAQGVQPDARSLRYKNIPSARAEEGVIRLLLLDDDFFARVSSLKSEEFSSPILGKIYSLLCDLHKNGQKCSLASLTERLTPEEMSFLVSIQQQPETVSNGGKAIDDYLATIRKTRVCDSDDALMVLRNSKSKNGGNKL